jgi:hypothetical protein
MDINQLRDAIAAPGLDLRYWVRFGKVLEVKAKDDEGGSLGHVELTVMEWPEGSKVTTQLLLLGGVTGTVSYPIKVDDMVLVAYPDGETYASFAIGPITTKDTSQDVLDNVQDKIEVQFQNSTIEEHFDAQKTTVENSLEITVGTNAKLTTKGGQAVIAVPDTNVVQLGGEGASDPVAKYNELATAWSGLKARIDAIEAWIERAEAAISSLGGSITPPYGIPGSIPGIDAVPSSKVMVDK